MISTEYREALNDLTELAGNVTPGVWQDLRRIKAKFEALLEPIQGLENAPLDTGAMEDGRGTRDVHK